MNRAGVHDAGVFNPATGMGNRSMTPNVFFTDVPPSAMTPQLAKSMGIRSTARAMMHLSGRRVDLSGCESVVPSESLGEVGAASAAVGSILSLFGFAMDGTSRALVWSMSDTGQVAAIRLSAADAGAAA